MQSITKFCFLSKIFENMFLALLKDSPSYFIFIPFFWPNSIQFIRTPQFKFLKNSNPRIIKPPSSPYNYGPESKSIRMRT